MPNGDCQLFSYEIMMSSVVNAMFNVGQRKCLDCFFPSYISLSPQMMRMMIEIETLSPSNQMIKRILRKSNEIHNMRFEIMIWGNFIAGTIFIAYGNNKANLNHCGSLSISLSNGGEKERSNIKIIFCSHAVHTHRFLFLLVPSLTLWPSFDLFHIFADKHIQRQSIDWALSW